MVAVLAPITKRVIQQPKYVAADSFGQWLRLNHMLCWDYWCELDDGEGKDAERQGAFAEFHEFAKSQFDIHCAVLEENDEVARVFRTADEAAAYEAGVRSRGEI